MEETVLYRDSTEVFSPLEADKVSNVSSLSAFLATLNQTGSSGTRFRRFLDETGSLDVNVGDNNSCRLSDISSISYTNVTQDDNESLGCETNASLDNVIDSASSCRSDEESPYELDQDETDYGLDSSGYFGNQELFVERPTKVDKSSMTVPSDDDIKNFMNPSDLHVELNSGFSADAIRDATNPLKVSDHRSINDFHAEDSQICGIQRNGTLSNEAFNNFSNLDHRSKSPNFLQGSSDESSTEMKEIFVNNSKVELKLNGMIGNKSAISNCKGSKVTLEFYCGKNISRDKSEKPYDAKDAFHILRSSSKSGFSNFEEDVVMQTDITDQNKSLKECESDSFNPKPVWKNDEAKRVRIPSKIRPSPGLAKRIGESKAEIMPPEVKQAAKPLPASNSDALLANSKTSSGPAKNEETVPRYSSHCSVDSEQKAEEKKKPNKALDFCNEDIESSLNEIRSILYGSRIGLAKSCGHAANQSVNSHAKTQTVSQSLDVNSNQSANKESFASNDKMSNYYEIHRDLLMCDEDNNNDRDDEQVENEIHSKENPEDNSMAKAEISVIDELLEELRMGEPSFSEDHDDQQTDSPGVEMKSDFKYKLQTDSERSFVVNLSVPFSLEKKTFSLSPEATDCDSIDASSIISDEGKTSPSAMPVVEDGLSSEEDDKDGLNNSLGGNKSRKSYATNNNNSSSRSENIPRVQKHDDKFLPTSSSGSISNMSVSSSHSKHNGLPVKMKPQEKQALRRDVKAKDNSSENSSAHYENAKDHVDAMVIVRSEKQDLKIEVEKNSDGQDIIEMKKMSEIALFQSSTKGSTVQKSAGTVSTGRIGEDEDDKAQKMDPSISGVDGYEERLHLKTGHSNDDEVSEEGSTQKDKSVATSDSRSPPDDKSAEKKLGETTSAKNPNDDKTRTKNYENERESFLIEGVLFRAQYLGSTQLVSEGQPSKATRLMQAQEAINRIKDPTLKGNPRPSTLVDLFVSVEKIMVLNTDLQEIMMDHALRTISYIADIGDVLVVMARRGPMNNGNSPGAGESTNQDPAISASAGHNQAKICCHVFESDEAQLIAQSISQAFQVAYIEFLKANGINDPDLIKEMDYQDVLSQQEIFGEELFLFSNRDMQKEVLVPKSKGEPLGMVIVESGWGSMVPTVVLANMAPGGAAARCGQLNIGDQIISVNGISLVGLPLSTCQAHLKALRNEILARFMVVSCTPVVEVLVKRPDIKYQLGFSVQNGVICSLLRGGIAERGGVRVGHRIIEINGQSVVAVPHDKIVSMLASSVGEIHMKTMQTSIYRLLTGQDTPHYI